jgi:hypothetical protein
MTVMSVWNRNDNSHCTLRRIGILGILGSSQQQLTYRAENLPKDDMDRIDQVYESVYGLGDAIRRRILIFSAGHVRLRLYIAYASGTLTLYRACVFLGR